MWKTESLKMLQRIHSNSLLARSTGQPSIEHKVSDTFVYNLGGNTAAPDQNRDVKVAAGRSR